MKRKNAFSVQRFILCTLEAVFNCAEWMLDLFDICLRPVSSQSHGR